MSFATLTEQFEQLPPSYQEEVVHFIQFLNAKSKIEEEDKWWQDLSLSSALKGLENDPVVYTVDDLKVRWK